MWATQQPDGKLRIFNLTIELTVDTLTYPGLVVFVQLYTDILKVN